MSSCSLSLDGMKFNLQSDINEISKGSSFSVSRRNESSCYDEDESDIIISLMNFTGTLKVTNMRKSSSLHSSDKAMRATKAGVNGSSYSSMSADSSSLKKEELPREESSRSSCRSKKNRSSFEEIEFLRMIKDPKIKLKEIEHYLKTNQAIIDYKFSGDKNYLQIMAENENLIERSDEFHMRHFIFQQLTINPRAFCNLDSNNQMPFASSIADWINGSNSSTRRISYRTTSFSALKLHPHEAVAPSGQVQLSPHIIWTFQMLSLVLHRLMEPNNRDSTTDFYKECMLDNFAHIPSLVKTILYIEHDACRSDIIRMPITQHVLLRKETVGNWLVAMLTGRKEEVERAVNYLEYLSNASFDYTIDPKRVEHNMMECHKMKEQVIEYLAKCDGILAALLTLDPHQRNRATSTYAVYRMLDYAIFNLTSICSISLELSLNILLLVAFSVQYTILMGWTETHTSSIQGFSLSDCLPWVMIFWICSYFFFIDEICTFRLYPTWRGYFQHYNSFTNIINLMTVIGATYCCISIMKYGRIKSTAMHAIVFGMIWLKLFCYLNRVNHNFASFIHTLGNVMVEASWLLVFMFALCLIFSDTSFIVVTSDNSTYCDNVTSDQIDVQGDLCSPSNFNRVLRAYATLAGDTALDDYRENVYLSLLWVLFTFVGIIGLLNVLIGIVTDAYTTSVSTSHSATGRARLPMLAKHESMKKNMREMVGEKKYSLCFHLRRFILTIIFLLYLSIFHYGAYTILLTAYFPPNGQALILRPNLVASLVLLFVLLVDISLTLQFCEFHFITCSTSSLTTMKKCSSGIIHFVTRIISKLLGILDVEEESKKVVSQSMVSTEYIISRVQEVIRQEVRSKRIE